MRHDSSPCETLPQLCFAALHLALPLPRFTLLCHCHASPCFAISVLSPAMLSRRFAGKRVAQLRLRLTAHYCAMPLLCLSLPYFTAAMPCFALMRLDLPCSYSARLSSAWLRLRVATPDLALPTLDFAMECHAVLCFAGLHHSCATIDFAVAMPCSALLCLRAAARVNAWPLHGGSVLCFTFALRSKNIAVPYRAVKGHAVATRV